MVTPQDRSALLEYLERMSPEQRRDVLDYARRLVESPRTAIGGSALMDALEPFDASAIDRLEQAIEDGCEQIDDEQW